MTLPVISGLYGGAVALLVLLFGSMPKKSLLNDGQEWLFHNFFERLFESIFNETDPAKIAMAFGLEYDKYMLDCSIVGRTPNMTREAMMRVVGVFLFVLGIPLAVILMNPIPIFLGIAAYYVLATGIPRSVHSKAEQKKGQLVQEMPCFVDLLLSALEIGLPIENAIQETMEAVPCVLSQELKASFAEAQIGAKNWQQALEGIAQKYELDILSDFVLDIITSYNKGVSVKDAVARESFEVRQTTLLTAKEKTAKMTSIILVPLVIFKMLPLVVIMMAPIVMEIFKFM